MTYTPTPNFGGSVPAGEFTFHYDACGNMVLMTNASGDPQLSYDIDRATNGIVNTFNPGNMENIIGIGGKRGQLTIPGFGDDDMTLPIQRPGQLAVIGDNGQAGSGYGIDITTAGAGASDYVYGALCGEVGTCSTTPEQLFERCMTDCYKKATGRTDWLHDYNVAMEYSGYKVALRAKTEGAFWEGVFWTIIAILLKNPVAFVLSLQPAWIQKIASFLSDLGVGLPTLAGILTEAFNGSIQDIKDNMSFLESYNPWLKNEGAAENCMLAVVDCVKKCESLLPDPGDVKEYFEEE